MANLQAAFDVPQKAGDEIRIQAAAVQSYFGGAAAIVQGVGYATPLVVGTSGMQFIGVYLESNNNTLGTPGTLNNGYPNSGYSSWVRVARRGVFCFHQAGIVEANVGQYAYFSDDNTVGLTPSLYFAGVITSVDQQNGLAWVDIGPAVLPILQQPPIPLAASGAISPSDGATYVITDAAAAALTLAAPAPGVNDGEIIVITSNTAYAHTLTATGLLQTGSASVNHATFAAYAGASITLMAYQGKWNVISANGITFS